MLDIIVVNKNCLQYTKDCIADLKRQNSSDFAVTLIDNNSEEIGTRSFYSSLDIPVVYNDYNRPLNHIWNDHYASSKHELICLLNNDVRLPPNFVSDTLSVFQKEPQVGVVVHSTNHPSYQTATPGVLDYKIVEHKFRQGWDFSFRKEAYTKIPEDLYFFCGDDFLYENVFSKGYKGAMILSSPIIHYQGKTRSVPRNAGRDILIYTGLGYKNNLSHLAEYVNIHPTFKEIKIENNNSRANS